MLAACGSDPSGTSSSEAWGSAAEQWLANVQEAGREGIPNLEPFLTPEVVLDHRGTGGDRAVGLDASFGLARGIASSTPEVRITTPPYLSAEGMVVPVAWPGRDLLTVHDAVLVMTLTPAGLVHEESASSLLSGQSLVDPDRDWSQLEDLAEEYVAEHTTETRTTTLDGVPDLGGPAVFGIPRVGGADGFRRAVLLLTAEDDSGCPGRLAVSLTLGRDGRVLDEERYHRVDDARRCLDEGNRFEGWWTTMQVPDPVQHERTGTVRAGDVAVEVWNGTPVLEQLVARGLEQFPEAGLTVPRPSSVTFYPAADRCRGNLAVAAGEANDEIVACFGEGLACVTEPCPPWSRKAEVTILHELAHTWMSQNLTEDTRTAYERLTGMTWASPEDPWEQRAIERAAEVIAWGVHSSSGPPEKFELSEQELFEEYRLLTGTLPASSGRW